MELQTYTDGHIDSFLLNYKIFIQDLSELADDWPALDEDERSHHRSEFMQIWGNRKMLGALFQAGRLPAQQVTTMDELDRYLLKQAALMNQCFGLDLSQLLTIFRWGTPLAESTQPVQIEVEPASLNRMASSLAPALVN
ncbi:hypothetical protein KFU94_63570 [Chloroflexi bacterium TSY]|nr:hypothetical protein [Chloroflexi bacterium TSY]